MTDWPANMPPADWVSKDGSVRLHCDVANQNRYHPTQKPVRVMEACIQFVKQGSIVCDPYFGSGSTGLACIRTSRRFLGIEIEEKYFQIARARIEEAFDSQALFRQDDPQPDPELFAPPPDTASSAPGKARESE